MSGFYPNSSVKWKRIVLGVLALQPQTKVGKIGTKVWRKLTTFVRIIRIPFKLYYTLRAGKQYFEQLRGYMRKTNRSTEAGSWPFESGTVSVWQKDAKLNLYSASQIRRVLLLGNGSLFDEGIIDLLKNQPNLRITHAKYRDDNSIVTEVVRYRPDVVVLILSKFTNPEDIVGRLMSVAGFHLQLVLLSLETIEIEIYERGNMKNEVKLTRITALKVDDFLLAIYKKQHDATTLHNRPGTVEEGNGH